ncbi:MAG TPA: hypothetical protein VIV11_35075 [Kofleriaceae bacterium]
MKRTLLLVAFASCDGPATLQPWQLDHDRVVAVRAELPHIAPGEVTILDGLIAHADGPTSLSPAANAAAPNAPGDLFTAVHFYINHWRVDGPDEARLAVARAELGLPADAPVPLDVVLEFPGPLYAQKTVWLGDSRANPAAPALVYGPTLALGVDYELVQHAPANGSVRWLTSCGTLVGDTEPRVTHVVDEPCEGELVVVVRDAEGGVAWQVLPISAK